MFKRRLSSIIIILIAGLLGYLSRRFANYLPSFLATYTGDTLWAFAAYYLIKLFFIDLRPNQIAGFAFLFSALIEISQLYHASWIDQIRNTLIGGLALGFGFHWSDLVCYLLGVILAALLDFCIRTLLKTS